MTEEEALKDYMAWLDNIDKPITEVKRSIDVFDYEKKFGDNGKPCVVRYYYKVEWLQGVYRSFRRFKEDEKEKMEEFWQHVLDVSAKNNPKVEDLLTEN